MSFLSKAFRRKSDGLPPWAALDQEALRISAAMEHVQDHGNLDAFPGNQNEKLALMLTASRQGLVTWNRAIERYELTSLGRERLGMRLALQEPGGPMNLPPASAAPPAPAGRWALGSGTIMAGVAGLAIGAVAMALLPGSTSKAPPRDKAAVATASKPADAGNPPRQVYPQAQTAAPASTQPPAPRQEQAAIHPGEAGAAAGALAQEVTVAGTEPAPTASAEASLAPAPQLQPQRRTAERSRKHQAAPPAGPAGLEQPGFARSAEEPSAGATDESSRSRVATEPQKSWSESKRKTGKSRREYATEDEGAPREGVTVRRYEEDNGPPVAVMRRPRGEPSLRRGGDEEARPGYARRESPTFSYRDREGPPRFGLFDWLFR